MGFTASTAVEPLNYDFTPHVDAQGTIPEPTNQQIEEFREQLGSIITGLGLSPEEIRSGKIAFDKVDTLLTTSKVAERAMMAAVANLTGLPDATLAALPYRLRAAFMGWIVGQFNSPEA